MIRLLAVAGLVGLAGVNGAAWAGPPQVAGKERTHIEQEHYLPESPTPRAASVQAGWSPHGARAEEVAVEVVVAQPPPVLAAASPGGQEAPRPAQGRARGRVRPHASMLPRPFQTPWKPSVPRGSDRRAAYAAGQ